MRVNFDAWMMASCPLYLVLIHHCNSLLVMMAARGFSKFFTISKSNFPEEKG